MYMAPKPAICLLPREKNQENEDKEQNACINASLVAAGIVAVPHQAYLLLVRFKKHFAFRFILCKKAVWGDIFP